MCRLLVTSGANATVFNNMRYKPIDVATPPVSKMLAEEEEAPARGDSDVESQLLEAAKNGDLVIIKVKHWATWAGVPAGLCPISAFTPPDPFC